MKERAFILGLVGKKRTALWLRGNTIKLTEALLHALAQVALKARKPGRTLEETAAIYHKALLDMMRQMQQRAK